MGPFVYALARPLREVALNLYPITFFSVSFILLTLLALVSVNFFSRRFQKTVEQAYSYFKFFHASFLKPHQHSFEGGQQSALESFYKTQAAVYDATRKRLLQGREDMLGLMAAQMYTRLGKNANSVRKPIWVDIGGGTGYNIEIMHQIQDIEEAFDHVYLVDLSPSLCEMAEQRVQRFGWRNVSVICQDARSFRLAGGDADLITMSYSLSMIPDFYSVIDTLATLLAPKGLIGVCDFYVQSVVDISTVSYIGGSLNRHVNWLGRLFWRAWFDADRVNLDGGRRSYVEYRFGSILSSSARNYTLGGIPYYIFIGCGRDVGEPLEKLDAALTESPYLSPNEYRKEMSEKAQDTSALRSKAYESAIVNLSANLPLPSTFYQNQPWRIYYNDLLPKHQQFGDQYIYAFNWEDPEVDRRLLNIQKSDVILAITSAGDNVLDYLLESPSRIHAVDLNPNQGHLLELKVASFIALSHADNWKLFGDGRLDTFRETLIQNLSPHLSSHATQYWLDHASVFTSAGGLYETGGSRYAIKLCRWLFSAFGLTSKVRTMCSVETLNEQREIWPHVRRVLFSWPLHRAVIGTKWWAWKAAGVPPAQRQMIQEDYAETTGLPKSQAVCGQAIWTYLVNTLDPVVDNSLLSRENYFYNLCLQGRYSRKCHPRYLGPKAHAKLSKPGAFDGLRIHTDELMEVIARIMPSSLTVAVLMDSMDWFDPNAAAAKVQVVALNKVMKLGGRVLLRSAALKPWYVTIFEQNGFAAHAVGPRTAGKYVDRVNMYASTWLLTKTTDAWTAHAVSRATCAPTMEDIEI